jgi:hypothetical protein
MDRLELNQPPSVDVPRAASGGGPPLTNPKIATAVRTVLVVVAAGVSVAITAGAIYGLFVAGISLAAFSGLLLAAGLAAGLVVWMAVHFWVNGKSTSAPGEKAKEKSPDVIKIEASAEQTGVGKSAESDQDVVLKKKATKDLGAAAKLPRNMKDIIARLRQLSLEPCPRL